MKETWLDKFCWGTVYHMLGFNEAYVGYWLDFKAKVPTKVSAPLIAIKENILEYQKHNETIGFKPNFDADSILDSFVKECGEIFSNNNFPIEINLALEPKRGFDGKRLNRNPFKPFNSRSHGQHMAFAGVCYLLRGCSLFFFGPPAQRDLNAAKTALNDLHQAALLAWRLYHNLKYNHHSGPGASMDSFFEAALRDSPSIIPTAPITEASAAQLPVHRSHYFVWSLLILSDIYRGNVYREIDFLEEADRYYRHAYTRFNLLWDACSSIYITQKPWVATNTVIRAFLERSKVLFDLGQILLSLLTQVKCLELLLCQQEKSEHRPLLKTIKNIRNFLEMERRLPIFDRDMVTWHFGDPLANPRWSPDKNAAMNGDSIFNPHNLVPISMNSTHAQVASDILARIGFALYTIARKCPDNDNWVNWLDSYCNFEEKWKTAHPDQNVMPSALGYYCQTLYKKRDSKIDSSIFGENIERRFSLLLRNVCGEPTSTDLDRDFYRAVLDSTTQNIANIATIPRRNHRLLMRRGYKYRRIYGDLSELNVYQGMKKRHKHMVGVPEFLDAAKLNKLVVLRRWQSFNPKIPRFGYQVRGGGYFLLWQGKGIVIDPGFDFIQNFYEQGFSLEDIDAIVITHSHPDHDDDLSTLTTLFKEWNDFNERSGEALLKPWDLFLNESTHKKFSSWLQAASVRVGRIISLPMLCWDKDTDHPKNGPMRGKNIIIDLRLPSTSDNVNSSNAAYNLQIEVVPAWHDDVIGQTASVGLIFHLSTVDHRFVGKIGYTGDSGAYGLGMLSGGEIPKITEQYCNCDIVIAHLGDIRLREVAHAMGGWKNPNPLMQLVEDLFSKECKKQPSPDTTQLIVQRLRNFMYFLSILNLIPKEILREKVAEDNDGKVKTVKEWFRYFIEETNGEEYYRLSPNNNIVEDIVNKILEEIPEPLRDHLNTEWNKAKNLVKKMKWGPYQTAYNLALLCAISSFPAWQYQHHLGIYGIWELFKAIVKNPGKARSRLFIVGELPEELSSHRHAIACWLNAMNGKIHDRKPGPVFAFTGDIGLHINLNTGKNRLNPKIRCAFCNYNNELVCSHENYHEPDKIKERMIKAQQSSMIYLCTTHDHYPEEDAEFADFPKSFLVRPQRPLM
jgi:hypothetical protein